MQTVFVERMNLIMTFQVNVILEHISPFVEIIWSLELCRCFFVEDVLHYEIFALVLFI